MICKRVMGYASVAVAGIAVGTITSGSVFTLFCSSSSGVDSLIEMSGGGGIFSISSSEQEVETVLLLLTLPAVLLVFLRLPLGAGSRLGVVRLYVTVLVTTLRTLTGLGQALRGVASVSNVLLVDQSAGENGEYRAL